MISQKLSILLRQQWEKTFGKTKIREQIDSYQQRANDECISTILYGIGFTCLVNIDSIQSWTD